MPINNANFGYSDAEKVDPSQYRYFFFSLSDLKLAFNLGTIVPIASPPLLCEAGGSGDGRCFPDITKPISVATLIQLGHIVNVRYDGWDIYGTMTKNYYRISGMTVGDTSQSSITGHVAYQSISFYDFCPKGKEISIGFNAMNGPRYTTFYPPQK